jgi:O-antigen/teichoic acid export membrane protein
MIPSILLERRLAFEKQIIPQIIESLVFNGLVVFLAVRNFGVASYSWSILVSSLVGLPIYYLISPWLPSLSFSTSSARKMIRYGIPFQGKSILAIVKDDLLTFFLSGVVGPGGIGYWGFAQKFAYYPFRFIVDSVTKVTFPAYSRVQHDKDLLKTGVEKSLMAVSILVFPILTLMALLAKNVLILIPKYHQWLPALPSFYFLCAAAMISALSNILVNTLDATGRVKTTLSLMIFWIILTWGSVLILVPKFGFTGISIANLVVASTIVVTIYLVKQTIKFNFLSNIYQPLIASLIMAVAVYFLSANLPNNFQSLGALVLVAGIIYLAVMFLLGRKALLNDLKIIVKSFKHD